MRRINTVYLNQVITLKMNQIRLLQFYGKYFDQSQLKTSGVVEDSFSPTSRMATKTYGVIQHAWRLHHKHPPKRPQKLSNFLRVRYWNPAADQHWEQRVCPFPSFLFWFQLNKRSKSGKPRASRGVFRTVNNALLKESLLCNLERPAEMHIAWLLRVLHEKGRPGRKWTPFWKGSTIHGRQTSGA